MIRAAAVPVLALALAACGSKTDLTPPPGHALPVAPYGREQRLSAEELLTRPPQAAPERSVELRRRSEERQDDPFDLPPDTGREVVPKTKPAKPCPQVASHSGEPQLAGCPQPTDATAAG